MLLSISIFQADSQTPQVNLGNSNENQITFIKAFESKYFNDVVYLHITVNGNTKTNFVAVERSLDAVTYEVIGYIKVYGTDVKCDLAYYFTDKSPGIFNLFYRLSDYSTPNEPSYSETLNVIPANEHNTPRSNKSVQTIGEQLLVGKSN